MSLSAQLENEAERTRSDLRLTVQELIARLTVSQAAAEFWHYMRDGVGRNFARGLGRQVRSNPMPAALIGAGIAWMAFGGGSRKNRSGMHMDDGTGAWRRHDAASTAHIPPDVQPAERRTMGEMADQMKSTIGNAASSAAETVSQGASSAYRGAASAYQSVADTATQTASAVANRTQQLWTSAGETSRNYAAYCADRPLLLTGIGVAVGAGIAAALPMSRYENRMLGGASDRLKRNAERFAGENLQRMESVAEETVDHLADTAMREMRRGDGMHAGAGNGRAGA